MLFDGPAALPTATLLPRASEASYRVIGGHLRQWLAQRWTWLRPRTVPMIIAFVGMLGVLSLTKYLPAWSYVEHQQPRAWHHAAAPVVNEASAYARGMPTVAPDTHGFRCRMPRHSSPPFRGDLPQAAGAAIPSAP